MKSYIDIDKSLKKCKDSKKYPYIQVHSKSGWLDNMYEI